MEKRQIKFRFWDEADKKFVHTFLGFAANFQTSSLDNSFELRVNSRIEAMQFTGAKDSKGNEIYESDIVEFNGDLGVIFWDDGDCGFFVKMEKGDFVSMQEYEYFTVWGNIHENENLIK
jgi:YopX protein